MNFQKTLSQVISQRFQSAFFEAAHLGLGDPDETRHLHLGFSLVKTKPDDMPLPVRQLFHRLV